MIQSGSNVCARRNDEFKDGTTRCIRGRPQLAAVSFDDRTADRQPQPKTAGLRRARLYASYTARMRGVAIVLCFGSRSRPVRWLLSRSAGGRTSPRLNGYFELLVGPALMNLGLKFERATGYKLSGWAHSRRGRPLSVSSSSSEREAVMSRHGGSAGQFPARTDEMTGVAIGIAL
jgi:hypothetical protein